MTNESIKDLVFRLEPEEVRRVPMYRSKLSSFVRQNIKKTKDCHRTMGLPKEMLTPKPFKKGSRKVIIYLLCLIRDNATYRIKCN